MPLPYQLTVNGAFDATWLHWFDGLTITHDAAGDTRLRAPFAIKPRSTA